MMLDFLVELRQMVVRRASAMQLVDTLAFVTEVAERLEEDPVFGEFMLAEHIFAGCQEAAAEDSRIHGAG